jgi:hypothetical protein
MPDREQPESPVEPDYTKASVTELQGVVRHVDGVRYPQRLARATAELARREEQAKEEGPGEPEVPLPVLAALRGAYWWVCLNAIVLVLLQIGTWVYSGFERSAFVVVVRLPFFTPSTETIVSWVVTALVTAALAVGSLSWRYRRHPFQALLGAGYLGLSLMVKLGGIAWWPRLAVANWVVAFGLGDGPDAPVAAGIIIVPLLWMLWTSLLDMNSGVETPDYMAGED